MIDGMASSKPRRIVILAFPGVQPLDVIGPAEVFAGADGLAGGGAYTVEVVAKEPGPIATRGGGLLAGAEDDHRRAAAGRSTLWSLPAGSGSPRLRTTPT